MTRNITRPAILALAACGDVASHDSKAFSYNKTASGFDQATVKKLVAFDGPSKKLAGYAEQPTSKGLIAFTTSCAA